MSKINLDEVKALIEGGKRINTEELFELFKKYPYHTFKTRSANSRLVYRQLDFIFEDDSNNVYVMDWCEGEDYIYTAKEFLEFNQGDHWIIEEIEEPEDD